MRKRCKRPALQELSFYKHCKRHCKNFQFSFQQALQETGIARIFSFTFSLATAFEYYISNLLCKDNIYMYIVVSRRAYVHTLPYSTYQSFLSLQSQNSENESSVKWSRSHELELQSLGFSELVAIPVEIRGSVK